MPLNPGERLGPYEIVGPLGAGGMGEVYEARDTRLARKVAIKVSKKAFDDRFRNEALAIAALNHPHIATLYDVGPDYLVMEFVDGKPLKGPLPAKEALRLAGQIAEALEHAHKAGIVHRDLKPANILLTRAGVKVLDFGLAKRVAPERASAEEPLSQTETGAVLGTPRYMSPEQIEGQKADERTDIFAFGLVLYEVLTGRRPFDGDSTAGVMAAILHKDPPPISELKPEIPSAVAKVVTTCLAKDPADRWQSVRELRHALDWAGEAAPPSRRLGAGARGAIAAAVATALLVSAILLWRLGVKPPSPPPVRLHVTQPPGTLFPANFTAAVAPDGQSLALALVKLGDGASRIFVRRLGSLEALPVAGSERGFEPFWSPDGREIGFFGINGGLHRVDAAGGSPRVICSECTNASGVAYGATWGRGGVILYSNAGRLWRVPASGGVAEPLGALLPGETGRFWPQFLPDERHYIYLSLTARREDQGIYVGALDSDLRKRLVAAEYTAAFSPPGYLVFIKENVLVAQSFDASRLEVSGDSVPVLDEEVARFGGTTLGAIAHFSLSTNGVLAWRPAAGSERQLTWFDRDGQRVGTIGEAGRQVLADLSPDEKTAAVCRIESPKNRDIWLVDLGTGAGRRLTFDPHDDCGAIFSSDGKAILFFSDRRGVRELYRKPVDGSGEDELLFASRDVGLDTEDWSADGRFVVYKSGTPGGGQDIFVLPLRGGVPARSIPFLASPASEAFGTLSPNGRYMVYQSTESERVNVYVREVAPTGEPGPGRWQLSTENGAFPVWRPDGTEVYFTSMARLMAVEVRSHGPSFSAGPPKPLGISILDMGGPRYYPTRDGQRFLVAAPVKAREPVRVLLNWLPADSR